MGTSPTIEVGDLNDRTNNKTYQSIPASNPAVWHTVNAGAGQWQLQENGNATGPFMSLTQIAAANQNKSAVRAYLRLGMGPSYNAGSTGTVGWVSSATVAGSSYNFAVAGVVTGGSGSTPVPVMGGLWLLPGLLAGIGIFARRRKA